MGNDNKWARGKYRKQAEKELKADTNRKVESASDPDRERSAYYSYGDMPRGKKKNEMYTRSYQEYDKFNDPKNKKKITSTGMTPKKAKKKTNKKKISTKR